MVEIAIIVAAISLVSALAAAAFTGWWTYYSAERTRLIDAQKLVDRYSDPILLAAQDLQERLYKILVAKPASKPTQMRTATPKAQFDGPTKLQDPASSQDGPSTPYPFIPSDEHDRDSLHPSRDSIPSDERDWDPLYPHDPLLSQGRAIDPQSRAIQNQADNDNLQLYTAFLVGQYFSWTSIMRRQAQFLKFSTSAKNKDLVLAFQRINDAFTPADEADDPLSKPFSLPRSYQGAIGEIMTKDYDGDKPVCKGYATFYALWTRRRLSAYPLDGSDDVTKGFHQFFLPIIDGIDAVYAAKKNGEIPPDRRLRRLQHLFVDLVNLLDNKHMWSTPEYCPPDASCKCKKCREKEPRPRGDFPAARNQVRARQARRPRRVRNQEVGPPPFHSQTHDLEAANGHGEQQAENQAVSSELKDPASSKQRLPLG